MDKSDRHPGDLGSSDLELLATSPLFDPAWYLATYPDVAAANVDPLSHYLTNGATEGRDPGPRFSSRQYLRDYPDVAALGCNPLLHYLRHGKNEGREISSVIPVTADRILRTHFAQLQELPVYSVPRAGKRVTLFTDSINSGTLYGGVSTALILSAFLSRRLDAKLRVVTRTERPDRENLTKLFHVQGINWRGNVQFAQVAEDNPIDVTDEDLFITTSWWTTRSTYASVQPDKIIYILQEDERMFYPMGDHRLRCEEMLANKDLRFVVNSKLLFDYFIDTGLHNLKKRGVFFEPAFPDPSYRPDSWRATAKRNFFFYARPLNQRNLYFRGLEAISGAIDKEILDPSRWDIYFVGKDLCELLLPGGVKPILMENLSWLDYVTLVRRTDLGLSLMYTPHPSYPPLDLAACGAVAVTNRFGRKTSLEEYSNNIICVEPNVEALVEGIARGVELATNSEQRSLNYRQNLLCRDWERSFRSAIDWLLVRPS